MRLRVLRPVLYVTLEDVGDDDEDDIAQLQLKIAFNFTNSDMLPSHPTARISVHVASFYSAI
jgi:hypothetical protein